MAADLILPELLNSVNVFVPIYSHCLSIVILSNYIQCIHTHKFQSVYIVLHFNSYSV